MLYFENLTRKMTRFFPEDPEGHAHRVPHDDVDVRAEGIVDVLGYVEVDKITEVVIHVDSWRQENTNTLATFSPYTEILIGRMRRVVIMSYQHPVSWKQSVCQRLCHNVHFLLDQIPALCMSAVLHTFKWHNITTAMTMQLISWQRVACHQDV